MNQNISGQWLINLTPKERFINATAEILEGDFHPSNPKLNLVGEYSKSQEGCGELDSMVLYEVVHEKAQMRNAMFMHMMQPFWAGYDTQRTNLKNEEKYLIFLKILKEVVNVYPKDIISEITYAMQVALDISEEKADNLLNGKMWHDFYLQDYETFMFSRLGKDSKGYYI